MSAPRVIAPAPPRAGGGLPAQAKVLFFGAFLNRFGSFVVPFMALYLTRRGYSAAAVGGPLGAYGAGYLVASILGGHLADRLGRRRTIMLSMFSSAAAILALSQAQSFSLIVALSFASGLCAELYRPACTALLTDVCPPEVRLRAWAVYRLVLHVGLTMGPLVAGILSQRSFFLLFVGDAATSVLFGVIAWRLLRDPAAPDASDGAASPADGSFAAALRDRRLVALLVAALGLALVDFQAGATLPLHVLRVGFSETIYGALLSINGALIVLFEIAVTTVTARVPVQWALVVASLLSGIGFAATGLARSVPALAATVVAWTVGEMIGSPRWSAYLSDLAPAHLRGRYMGLWGAMWSLGMLVGPLGGAWLFGRSPALLWWACGAAGVISAALMAWAVRPERREVAPPSVQREEALPSCVRS